jgi:hypothetical protein
MQNQSDFKNNTKETKPKTTLNIFGMEENFLNLLKD